LGQHQKEEAVEVDKISGNPVPPGAMPKEVRDNVDAKVSEGEYIIPANVVRYLGLEKIESLVARAKEALAQMTGDDLPFKEEELQVSGAPTQEEPIKMAAGGLVQPQIAAKPIEIPNEELPPWMIGNQNGRRESTHEPVTGLAGSVDKWSYKNFNDYANNLGSTPNRVIEGLVGSVPLGGLAMRARQNYLNNTVPTKMEEMLKNGTDLQGNKLTPDQVGQLQKSYDRLKGAGDYKPQRGGMLGAGAAIVKDVAQQTGIIQRKEPTPKKEDKEPTKSEKDKKNSK